MSPDRPSDGTMQEAISWFLIYAADQCPHLERRDVQAALYVGRRLEHAWRRLDLTAGQWIDDGYDVSAKQGERDLRSAARRSAKLPKLCDDAGGELPIAALRHLAAAGDEVNAIKVSRRAPRSMTVGMHLARRSFSAYRVMKYRWIDDELTTLDPQWAYQVFES